MAIRCDRVLTADGFDYWLDAGRCLFRSPSQGEWPPRRLDPAGLPAGWEFLAFSWNTEHALAALPAPDEQDVTAAGGNGAGEWESVTERLRGRRPGPTTDGHVCCRTRVSDRGGGQIYVQSPRTGMEAVIPFTRYEALGDLLEKIQTEFAIQTRDSRERKPWATIEYTPEELRLVAAQATQQRKARY